MPISIKEWEHILASREAHGIRSSPSPSRPTVVSRRELEALCATLRVATLDALRRESYMADWTKDNASLTMHIVTLCEMQQRPNAS